jgi:hypothetical protein
MSSSDTFTEKTLTLERVETADELRLSWRGKSNDRDPGKFLVPILGETLRRGSEASKRVVLDFSALEYMNSSTFSPLVKLLDEAARGNHRLTFEYQADRKWQSLSFSALKAFETPDGRIALRGK